MHNGSVVIYFVSYVFIVILISRSIGVDFGGQPGHVLPDYWETPMHLSLYNTFFQNILVCPPNIFSYISVKIYTVPKIAVLREPDFTQSFSQQNR